MAASVEWTPHKNGKVLVDVNGLDDIEGLQELEIPLARAGIASKRGGLYITTPGEVELFNQAVSEMQDLSPLVRAFLQCYKVENFALAPELLTALKATAAKASAYQVAMQKLVNIYENVEMPDVPSLMGSNSSSGKAFGAFSKGQSSIDTKVVLGLLSGGPRRAESNTDSCLPNVRIKGSTRQGQPYSEDPATATSFKLVISYPKSFAGRLIGEKGATMKRWNPRPPLSRRPSKPWGTSTAWRF